MIFSAQYGSPYAAYGNIQYARYQQPQQPFGAWPEKKPKQQGTLYGDWQEPEAVEPTAPAVDPAIAENIAIIKSLRARLQQTQDNYHRAEIRRQIEVAQRLKDESFRRAARIDEEETLFMLLH